MRQLCLILCLAISQYCTAQVEQLLSFEKETDQFLMTHVSAGFVDYKAIAADTEALDRLTAMITSMKLDDLSDVQIQSFYINAYNVLVIDQVIKGYPTTSVKEIAGFFDRTNYQVGGQSVTLNDIEKDLLLAKYEDSRYHFALVCGAKDCPKLWNRAITAAELDTQLENLTREALNDPSFLKSGPEGFGLSEIFRWNRFEFGGKKGILQFINKYRDEPIPDGAKTDYYEYDWTLNDIKFEENSAFSLGNNSFRYVTSAAIPKGGTEIKLFNNLYTQQDGDGQSLSNRSTFFTTFLTYLYGINNRFNLGFLARYRRVLNASLPSSALDVFGAVNRPNGRQRITGFGPQIRWAPVKAWSNFSIQSSVTFPIGGELSGGAESPFLDWAGPVFWTQFFNDMTISDQFSLFTEIDLLIEEIGGSSKTNRVSTPMTAIFSWFPKKNVTFYGLLSYSPFIVSPYDYFYQAGMGFKYQVTPDFEFEILVTDFSNRYLNSINGQAATYNLGFRYSR